MYRAESAVCEPRPLAGTERRLGCLLPHTARAAQALSLVPSECSRTLWRAGDVTVVGSFAPGSLPSRVHPSWSVETGQWPVLGGVVEDAGGEVPRGAQKKQDMTRLAGGAAGRVLALFSPTPSCLPGAPHLFLCKQEGRIVGKRESSRPGPGKSQLNAGGAQASGGPAPSPEEAEGVPSTCSPSVEARGLCVPGRHE